VQDAGLIFLSAIASSIVDAHSSMQQNDLQQEKTLATTLVILASSTLLLGLMLIFIGRLGLASYLQYLPMPVVGGYLAYIGFFCGEAGLSLMSGANVSNSDWDFESIAHLTPGILFGVSFYILGNINPSPWTLPLAILVSLTCFYGALLYFNISLEEARTLGWIMPLTREGIIYI